MPAVYDVTAAQVGTTLDTNGVMNGLACMNPPLPGGWPPPDDANGARLLTLVDDSGPGAPRTLFSLDPFTQPLAWAQLLMSPTYNLPFGNLTVKSCPAGALFRVNVA
jgi:hypothetical protein